MSRKAGSRYAEKQRLKHGSGAVDPRWQWWYVTVDEGVPQHRPLAAGPLSYGKGKRK